MNGTGGFKYLKTFCESTQPVHMYILFLVRYAVLRNITNTQRPDYGHIQYIKAKRLFYGNLNGPICEALTVTLSASTKIYQNVVVVVVVVEASL